MELDKPVIEYDNKGKITKFIVGTCDHCEETIDNVKDAYIQDKGKIYHANNKCYKG